MLPLDWFASLDVVTGSFITVAVEPALQVCRIVCDIDLIRPAGQHVRTFSQVVDVVDTKE